MNEDTKTIEINSDDWTKIQDAMLSELKKCGSFPPNRFLRRLLMLVVRN
jgi:hypothetical protein